MTEFELRQFLLAVATLLGAAHFMGYLFHRFGMPRVVGEIIGGLLVGQSGLGVLFPEVKAWIFDGFPGETKLLSPLYWIGLILLMFTSGFSMEKKVDPDDRRLFLALTLGTTAIPFIAGIALTHFIDVATIMGTANNTTALSLVVAIAMAVTSIPVISRIFIDLGIDNTRFARVVLSTAVAHDIVLWVALAVATGLVGASNLSTLGIGLIILKTLLFFSLSFIGGPWLISALTRNRFNLVKKASPIGWVLVICFLLVALASLLEVNVVFGALVAGMLFGHAHDSEIDKVRSRIMDFALAFFVPFYFSTVGFKLNLISDLQVIWTISFILACTICQLLASIISARAVGRGWVAAFNLGVAMNTRGGPGIVLATVALEIGIINVPFYTTLVLLSVFTSLAAGSWFRYQLACGRQL